MTLKSHVNFNQKLACGLEMTWGIWQIFTRAFKNLKNLHFNGLLLIKVYNNWAQKYTGVMPDGTQDWYKVWRKTNLCFQKWHEEFGKYSSEHIRKFELWDFYWVPLSKVENIWVWNLQGRYVSWQWRMIQDLNRNLFVSSKLTWEFNKFWPVN